MRGRQALRLLRLSLALALVLGSLPAGAEDAGRVTRRSEVLDRPVFLNLEAATPEGHPWCSAKAGDGPGAFVPPTPSNDPCALAPSTASATGYRLSVDGVVLEGAGRTYAEAQRCQDVRLAAAGIRIQADEHNARKVLSLDAWPDRAWSGEPVDFTAYWNYSRWVALAEVRLFALGGSVKSEPAAVVELNYDGAASWTPPPGAPGYRMVLRVYDRKGRFDETEPYDLLVSSAPHEDRRAASPAREHAVGYGKTHLALDRIPVSGARVTVSGERLKPGSRVYALGGAVPVSPEGSFAAEEILPPGRHDVAVKVEGPQPLEFTRPIYIAENRWFYVALADLTVGGNKSPPNAALVTGDTEHYANPAFVDGRAAFYLKGEVKGSWILTASADTREQPLSTVFSSLSEKDPKYLLRRLDPDRYYPVYGDDSTMTEDAPTQGKFYVRLERGESRIMWGNYAVRLRENELVQLDRALYGGYAHAVTDGTTKYGERKAKADAFIGDPGTLRAREEFRGTGGSLFYLRHLDITAGSDLISVEVRDKDSGIVLRSKDLARGQDYDIDALQGRLVLSQPLPSTADDSLIVRSADLSGNPVFLVARYEYQTDLSQIGDYTTGGRVSTWLGDHAELGATGQQEHDGAGSSSRIAGADATLRYTPSTYLKIQAAQSRGPGPGEQHSTDGGFSFNPVSQNTADTQAGAASAESAVQFSDLKQAWTGRSTGYWKARQSGFAGPGQLTLAETEQFGGTLNKPLPFQTSLDAKFDQVQSPGGAKTRTLDLDLRKGWGEHWSTSVGSRSDWRHDVARSSSPILSQTGQRTDVALQLGYDSKKRWSANAFGQGTVEQTESRLKNSRYGVGGKLQLTPRWTLTGEGSTGNGRLGGKVGTEARVNDRTTLYTTYQLESDRTDTNIVGRTGQLVSGAKTRYTDSTTIFGEERWQNGTGPTSLTHAYGVDIAAQDGWHWGLTGEEGTISDPNTGDTRRIAATGSVGVTRKDVKWGSALEYRDERGLSDRSTWLTRNSLAYQVHPDWRLITKLSYSLSRSSQGDFFLGAYTEGILGFAYRPTKNDKLNALFKYTYFGDLASPGQLTPTSVTSDYRQRSHILSADATYDLFPKVSIGGKYALRLSQVAFSRDGSAPWFSSTAHLGIARLDWHVVRKWDAVLEGRDLIVVEARDSRVGALLALYRHVSKNLRVGGGYNFTNYSDDLTDLSYRSHGWFFNVLADF